MLPLIPSLPGDRLIGVRLPLLRRLAKKMQKGGSAEKFMSNLPHESHEENMLHTILLSEMSETDALYEALNVFLPHIDNWAVCDSLRPRTLSMDKARLLDACRTWLLSPHPYTVRFGMEMLMCFFLDEDFSPEILAMVAKVDREEYYVRMMQAWFFAEALVKRYEDAFFYLKEHRLPDWVHRKTVSKACDSFRMSVERKAVCRETLK